MSCGAAIANRMGIGTSGVTSIALDVSSCKRGAGSTPGIPTRSIPPYISSSQRIVEELMPEHTKGSVKKKGTIFSPDEIDEELFRF